MCHHFRRAIRRAGRREFRRRGDHRGLLVTEQLQRREQLIDGPVERRPDASALNVRTQTYIFLGALAAAVGLWLFSRTSPGQSAVAGLADYVGDLVNGPRGIRNNN